MPNTPNLAGLKDKLGQSAGGGLGGSNKGRTKATIKGNWKVPELKKDFNLDKAVNKAYGQATSYMNKMLMLDDMFVEMQHDGEKTLGVVKDKLTGEVVSKYEGRQVLGLFSRNSSRTGVVVDGRV